MAERVIKSSDCWGAGGLSGLRRLCARAVCFPKPVTRVQPNFTCAAFIVVLACAGAAQAGDVSLEQVFDRCNAYGGGKETAFKGMAPVEVDPTDAAVTYQRIMTDAGMATVKLIDGKDCWVFGATFDPGHRSTTIAWDDIRSRARSWVFEENRGTIFGRTENDAGFNAVICVAGGKAHQNTATGGGTDDPRRALTFSSRQYALRGCS